MTRLAASRDTHLTPAEIAAEALRQFDEGGDEPSIRSLAKALKVAPSAIYHHYPSRAAIVEAVVELVWAESTTEMLEIEPHPYRADPVDVMVAGSLAIRRAWFRHYRLGPYVAATPESNRSLDNILALSANVFERLGLEGEDAAAAFHTYATFSLGSVIFGCARLRANEELAASGRGARIAGRFHAAPDPATAGRSSEATRLAIDDVMDLSLVDPVRDEELFVRGLRRLIESLRAAAAIAD